MPKRLAYNNVKVIEIFIHISKIEQFKMYFITTVHFSQRDVRE